MLKVHNDSQSNTFTWTTSHFTSVGCNNDTQMASVALELRCDPLCGGPPPPQRSPPVAHWLASSLTNCWHFNTLTMFSLRSREPRALRWSAVRHVALIVCRLDSQSHALTPCPLSSTHFCVYNLLLHIQGVFVFPAEQGCSNTLQSDKWG